MLHEFNGMRIILNRWLRRTSALSHSCDERVIGDHLCQPTCGRSHLKWILFNGFVIAAHSLKQRILGAERLDGLEVVPGLALVRVGMLHD